MTPQSSPNEHYAAHGLRVSTGSCPTSQLQNAVDDAITRSFVSWL